MTVEEAKKIVLAKYPDAEERFTDFSADIAVVLASEWLTEQTGRSAMDAAWVYAADRIHAQRAAEQADEDEHVSRWGW